mgnify:CR=1 FL=1
MSWLSVETTSRFTPSSCAIPYAHDPPHLRLRRRAGRFEHLACAALAEVMTTLGHSMTADEAMLAFAGRSLKDVLARAERLLSRPIPEDLGEQAAVQLMARFRRELQAVAGVKEAIAALPYRRCVASSSDPSRLTLSLDVTGLSALFGNNVFSAVEVANGKARARPVSSGGAAPRRGSVKLHRDRRLRPRRRSRRGRRHGRYWICGRQPRKPGPGRTSRCRGSRTGHPFDGQSTGSSGASSRAQVAAALDPSIASAGAGR